MFDYCCLATVSCRHKPKKLEVSGYQFSPSTTETVACFVSHASIRFAGTQAWLQTSLTNTARTDLRLAPVTQGATNTQQPRNTANPNSKAAYCLQAVGLRCTKTSLDVSSPRADSLPKFRSQTSSLSRTFTGWAEREGQNSVKSRIRNRLRSWMIFHTLPFRIPLVQCDYPAAAWRNSVAISLFARRFANYSHPKGVEAPKPQSRSDCSR